MHETPVVPNPGSHEATFRRGCRCDVYVNQFGRGLGESPVGVPMYEIHPDCPLHRPGSGWSPVGDVVLGRRSEPRPRTGLPVPTEKQKPGRKPRTPKEPEPCPGLPGEPCDRVEKLRQSGFCTRCHMRQWQRQKKARQLASAA